MMLHDIDLRTLANPYDFANPVRSRDRFTGRKKQLEEVRYYLDHAARSDRALNLALMGARAAGKTSVLNMIELEACDRGFCVSRIDLNESDAETPLAFFFKLFDCVFNSICETADPAVSGEKCFGGRAGRTFETYLDMISAYDVPIEKTWAPFLFPVQYAKAMASGTTPRISEHMLKQDLSLLQREVGRPIAVLFDECNVLSTNRVLLEMIRNLFMNMPGYMLVLAGTYDLFPVMDEVFSPIVRQFKKIDIDAFSSSDETEQCITKPLADIGLQKEDVFEPRTLRELSEIHNLTSGKPYEIQLLCHCMFRRVQRGEAQRMRLTLDVLDDVLAELRSGQDIYTRPVTAGVRALDRQQLMALRKLLVADGYASFEQLWFVEYVLKGTELEERAVLEENLSTFIRRGLLRMEGSVLKFAGDDFDAIYCKYFARHAFNVSLLFSRLPVEVVCLLEINRRLHPCESDSFMLPMYAGGDVDAVARELERVVEGFLSHDPAVFEIANPVVSGLYWQMVSGELRESEQISFARVYMRGPGFTIAHPVVFGGALHRECLANLNDTVNSMNERASVLGGEVTVTVSESTVWSRDELIDAAATSSNEVTIGDLVGLHGAALVKTYMSGDLTGAIEAANIILRLGGGGNPSLLNNVGYVLLADERFEEARLVFEVAVATIELPERALSMYNLAVACARVGESSLAIGWCEESLECLPEYHGNVVRLWIPSRSGEVIEWQEAVDPQLRQAIMALREVLVVEAQPGAEGGSRR